jgi:hypothetical protein
MKVAHPLTAAAEKCTHRPSRRILQAVIDGNWTITGKGDFWTFRSPPVAYTLRDDLIGWPAQTTYEAWREISFMPVGHRLHAISGVAYRGPYHPESLGWHATFKAALDWVTGWEVPAADDGLTDHCGCCGHRRGECGGPTCPCLTQGVG